MVRKRNKCKCIKGLSVKGMIVGGMSVKCMDGGKFWNGEREGTIRGRREKKESSVGGERKVGGKRDNEDPVLRLTWREG